MKNKTKRNWLIASGMGLLVVVLIIWGNLASQKAKSVAATTPENLPGLQVSEAPWQPEIASLRTRLKDIGLPALSQEGSALHIHQHLDIFIHGKNISVPAEIGVNPLASFISPIHTHDEASIIHVESPTIQDFTLGQFFDIWGVRLTARSIGGYESDTDNALRVFVNGKEFSGDPRSLVLAEKQEIVITYGTDSELPNPVPSAYSFPSGL